VEYLLDADVFIQAKNLHYGFDFCPAFWEWLINKNASKHVYSIEKVADELKGYGDELSDWTAQQSDDFFLKPDNTIVSCFTTISNWVNSQQYDQAAVSTFFQIADFYLIAYALAQNRVVITHEKPSNGRKKIKIPNVCIGLNIKCMTPFEMLRVERARFILGH
jgi:hypothetical protein